MPRPKLSNPSERTLYMRQYREKKMTEAERIDRAMREGTKAIYQKNPELRANRRRTRRRDVWRARQVVEAGVPLTFKRQMMTVEDALNILRGDGKRQHDLLGPRKPSKQKGVPKKRSYDTPAKLNDKIRQMVLAQGLIPASAPLLSEEPRKMKYLSMAETEKPKSLLDVMDSKPSQKKEKEPEFRLPSAVSCAPIQGYASEYDTRLAALQTSLLSQGKLGNQLPSEKIPEEHSPFGNQVFDFSPDK